MEYHLTTNDLHTFPETLTLMARDGWRVCSHNVRFEHQVNYGVHYHAQEHVVLWERNNDMSPEEYDKLLRSARAV